MFILRKKYFHCLLLSILLIISGCYDNEDIDRRVIVNPIGIDSESGGKMLISFRMFLISPGRGSSSPADQNGKNFIVRTSLASGIFPALNDIQVQDEHNIFMGQCRAIIFGETQAKNGLHQALDFINRTPTFPPNAFVVIGRPTATAIQYLKWPDTGEHDQNIRWFFSNRPNQKYGVTKWTLFRDIYDPLQDPLVPIVTPNNNNQTMKLIGLAVFSSDRMVGELNLTEATLLDLVRNTRKENRISCFLRQNNQASFHSVTGRRKIKVYYHNERPFYKITLRLNAFLGELTGIESPITEKELEMIRKRTESYLEKSLVKILKKLQVLKSDPLGLGEYFRAKHSKHFSIERWPLDYQQAEFEVKVKLFIERLGVLK